MTKINCDKMPEELIRSMINYFLKAERECMSDGHKHHPDAIRLASYVAEHAKPPTYKKFGITIEREPPLSEAPELEENMYVAELDSMKVCLCKWQERLIDYRWLRSGRLFRTKEAAQALIDALKKAEEAESE